MVQRLRRFETYRRKLPVVSDELLAGLARLKEPTTVICQAKSALENFNQLVDAGHPELKSKFQLLVITEAMKSLALAAGWGKVELATSASDVAVLEALIQ